MTTSPDKKFIIHLDSEDDGSSCTSSISPPVTQEEVSSDDDSFLDNPPFSKSQQTKRGELRKDVIDLSQDDSTDDERTPSFIQSTPAQSPNKKIKITPEQTKPPFQLILSKKTHPKLTKLQLVHPVENASQFSNIPQEVIREGNQRLASIRGLRVSCFG
mgnify:CR=1 FL=1